MERRSTSRDRLSSRRQKREPTASPRPSLVSASDPFVRLDDEKFLKRFRMPKQCVVELLQEVLEDLERPSKQGLPVPPVVQLLATLRFYGSGNFQIDGGDRQVGTQGSVGRVVVRVSRALAAKHTRFIVFPVGAEAARVRTGYFAIGGIPKIVGAIDGTHIRIQPPTVPNPELFRNTDGWFSINVQAVCDHNHLFTDLVARWFGSALDAQIFQNSRLCADLESGAVAGRLLGDSAYPSKPYLLTPIANPQTPAEKRLNRAHARSLATISRTLETWKRRFPCLSRQLRTKLDASLVVIVATAVVHNFLQRRKAPDFASDRSDRSLDAVVEEVEGSDGKTSAVSRLVTQNKFSSNLQ